MIVSLATVCTSAFLGAPSAGGGRTPPPVEVVARSPVEDGRAAALIAVLEVYDGSIQDLECTSGRWAGRRLSLNTAPNPSAAPVARPGWGRR